MNRQPAFEGVSRDRFGFGDNWRRFLEHLDEDRVRIAEQSLRDMLGVDDLAGRTFLDIGCGSGLFSLAARRLGARVHSFDYDPQSVACARELKRRFFPEDEDWRIGQGSALDREYLEGLGRFDIVYSWGVLHHTGAMWEALANAARPLADGGLLAISLYNHCGPRTAVWTRIKRTYNRAPAWLQHLMVLGWAGLAETRQALFRLAGGRNPLPFAEWREYRKNRGMSKWHDYVDWVGGYPFEAARPDEVFDFFTARGFCLKRLRTPGPGHVCNEFVFVRQPAEGSAPCAA